MADGLMESSRVNLNPACALSCGSSGQDSSPVIPVATDALRSAFKAESEVDILCQL